MRFGILGPLEVVRDGVRIPLGGVRRRAVMARLLLDARHVVTADRLIDAVWAERPPATARKTLQKYVFELRGVLAEPILRTTPGGYVLDVDDEDLDVRAFERMVEQSEFAAALALWRGEVLADLGDIGFVVAERTRLDELRLAAWQGRIEVDLAEGRLAEAIARLAELCAVHPNREPLIRLHMLALYQSGRQADSLEVYRNHRHRLAEELGVEPSKELQDLHVAILRREPTLSGAATSPSFLQPPTAGHPAAGAEFLRRSPRGAGPDREDAGRRQARHAQRPRRRREDPAGRRGRDTGAAPFRRRRLAGGPGGDHHSGAGALRGGARAGD